nr:hypothetical protein [Hypnea sp.]
MCICINCQHISICTTYKIILKQHKQSIREKNSLIFTPDHTLIKVNISQRLYSIKIEWDLVECSSFAEKPGCWLA